MKKNLNIILLSACAISAILFFIAGCVSKNPEFSALSPQQQATNVNIPAWIPDPRIAGVSNTVKGVADVTAPLNPYSPLTNPLIDGALGLWGVIATWVARNRNKALNVAAEGIIKAGPTAVQTVLDHAATSDHFTTVASVINDNTGANQTPTGAPKA